METKNQKPKTKVDTVRDTHKLLTNSDAIPVDPIWNDRRPPHLGMFGCDGKYRFAK